MSTLFPTSTPTSPTAEAIERKYSAAQEYEPLRFKRNRGRSGWLIALGGAAVIALAAAYVLRDRRTSLPDLRDLADSMRDWRDHVRNWRDYIPSRS